VFSGCSGFMLPASMTSVIKDPEKAPASLRVSALDAYRGLVMLLMMGEVLDFWKVSRNIPDSGLWRFLAHHQTHTEWIGCTLHDLIQPSFSFLVGAALPFSLASRVARGQSAGKMAGHALWRSVLLILLGVFLRSIGKPQTYWTFEDTLSQIGFGYFFLFLLGFRSMRWQWATLAFLLIGYWAAFALYPLPQANFDYAGVGVPADWPHLMTGFPSHWNKNSNLAWAFDTWFLNLFPRESKFIFNDGGYATLSFVPTLGTMILGLLAGGVLKSQRQPWEKATWMFITGGLTLLAGAALSWLGICPVVKRIWTPSWVLFSGGWCFLFLAGFYSLMDIWNHKKWAFPLVVIGMNSIAAYCIDHLCEDFIRENLTTNLGKHFYDLFGQAYAPLFFGALTLLVFWLLLFWMYRRKIFLRI
jgi:heparan-alpha-glucosaminide N-acetyltransferase